MAKYLTEFTGTFFLVLTIGLAQGVSLGALAIGSVLMVMVYMGGHVSGAHYNPAVSLAACIRGALRPVELPAYWVAQVLGAVAAALMVSLILVPAPVDAATEVPVVARYFGPAPGTGYTMASAGVWLVEILFACALCLVVLNVATSRATQGNSYYGLAIGFTVATGAMVAGPISGGAFNPAVGIGPNLVQGTIGGKPEVLVNILLHTLAPLAGGVVGAMIFRIQEDFLSPPPPVVAVEEVHELS